MAPWAAVRQWAKKVPIRLHVKHRHFRQTHKHTHDIVDVYTHVHTHTHTVSEGHCMSACQKHSGNKRSAGAVGNTREHVPALHLLLSFLFSPVFTPISLCYRAAPPCLSFPSLSLLCSPSLFENLFFSLSLPSLAPPSLPLSFLVSSPFPLFLFLLLLKSMETYKQSRSKWVCPELLFLSHKQPHPKLGISLPLSYFLSSLASPLLISTNKPIFNSYLLCAVAVSCWEVMHWKCGSFGTYSSIFTLFNPHSLFLYLACMSYCSQFFYMLGFGVTYNHWANRG